METLSSRVAREGGFAAADAVGWTVRLAKRIESLHVLGVAHGNVSGECVLIGADQPSQRGVLGDVRRARPGRAYHSPERCAGAGISQADDAWAIGVALYLGLTGTLPFLAATDDELTRKITAGTPSPLAVYDVGDDDLQRILDKVFAREASERTSSVSALRRALEAWQPALRLGALPPLDEDDDEDEEEREDATVMVAAPVIPRALAAGIPRPSVAANQRPLATPAPPAAARPPAKPVASPAPASPSGLMEDDDDAATVARGPSAARDFLDALMAQRAAADAPAPQTEPVAAPAPIAAPAIGRAPLSSSTALMPHVNTPIASLGSGTFVMSNEAHAALAERIARGPAPDAIPPESPPAPPPPPAPSAPMPPSSAPTAQAPLPPPPGIAAPPPKSRFGVVVALVSVALLAAVLIVGALVVRRRAPDPMSSSAAAPVSAAPPTLVASVEPTSSAASLPASSAAPEASASAAAAQAPIDACVRTMFPADTFDATAGKEVDFVCTESDPKKGADALRTMTVSAGGGRHVVTDGMREWAVLGWYDMAAFAAVRGRCCPSAAPLAIATPIGDCHLEAALGDLAAGASKGFPAAEKSLDDALEPYTTAVHCILRANLGDRFGRKDPIQGGEATAAKKTLARARAR